MIIQMDQNNDLSYSILERSCTHSDNDADALHHTSQQMQMPTLSIPPSTPPSTNAFIDKITLELLLNKTHYQKYLSKTDPQKFAEYQEFLENCSKYRRSIIDITICLLNDPKTKQYSQEVGDAFDIYTKTLIRYLEVKERSDNIQETNHFTQDEDDDVLFPAIMDIEQFVENPFVDIIKNGRQTTVSSVGSAVGTSTNGFSSSPYTMDRFVIRK